MKQTAIIILLFCALSGSLQAQNLSSRLPGNHILRDTPINENKNVRGIPTLTFKTGVTQKTSDDSSKKNQSIFPQTNTYTPKIAIPNTIINSFFTLDLHNTASKKDFVLYRNIIRQNGWYVGAEEPITRDVAVHLPYYYRLSMKNKAGNYQYVEALHGDTLTDKHSNLPYIISRKVSDDTCSSLWSNQVRTAGQWLLISDLSGKEMIEERAYAASEHNAAFVYAFQPIANDGKHMTGSYINSSGLPVDIDESEDHYYGNVVYVTSDSNGCDSIIDFLDGRGLRRYTDGNVDQKRTAYDSRRRIVRETRHNAAGDMINDSSGVCGQVYLYDDSHSCFTVTNIDKDNMPVYSSTPLYPAFTGCISCRVILDCWGRISEQIILDGALENGATTDGVHRIAIEYDEGGNITSVKKFDLQNILISECNGNLNLKTS